MVFFPVAYLVTNYTFQLIEFVPPRVRGLDFNVHWLILEIEELMELRGVALKSIFGKGRFGIKTDQIK